MLETRLGRAGGGEGEGEGEETAGAIVLPGV